MKPRTKQELAQLTKMNPGAFIESGLGKGLLLNNQGTSKPLELPKIHGDFCNKKKSKRKPLFDRFYDYMSNLINGNKSIAPAELKSF